MRSKINKKAQVATEFIMVVGLAMVIIIIFISVLYYWSYNYSEEKNINRLMDLGFSLQSELIIASEVEYGYERTISIPATVDGIEYSINQTANDLVITYKGADLLFPIPQISSGELSKGINTISKTAPDTIIIT